MTNYIVAKNYLCFMALLEMIVAETNPHSHFTQIDFAELYGITIPIGENTSIKNVRYSNNIEECGADIRIKEINDFFKKNMITLQLSHIPSNYFDEMVFNDLIVEKSKVAKIIFAFCYGILYNEPHNNTVGHVALFESIDVKNDTIKIYDPGPRNHGSKIVKTDDIVYAMKRRGGIYLFEKKEY